MNNTLDHEYYEALIPAYAIGAADDEDCRTLEDHLAGCAPCCAQLQEYQNLEQGMLFAVPPVSAPFGMTEDLRRRIAPAGGIRTSAARRDRWSRRYVIHSHGWDLRPWRC